MDGLITLGSSSLATLPPTSTVHRPLVCLYFNMLGSVMGTPARSLARSLRRMVTPLSVVSVLTSIGRLGSMIAVDPPNSLGSRNVGGTSAISFEGWFAA